MRLARQKPSPDEASMAAALRGATSLGLLSQAWFESGADDTAGALRERLIDVYRDRMRALGALHP